MNANGSEQRNLDVNDVWEVTWSIGRTSTLRYGCPSTTFAL
jgi:hypothetical protein